jgi:putative oxidoreductase
MDLSYHIKMINLNKLDGLMFLVGRSFLGIYFLLPGILKIFTYSETLTLMISKGVPLASLALPITIVLQVGLSLLIIANKHLRISAVILFGLTILINIFIHNFWDLSGDPSYGHEMQNFVKNTAIAAGLLVLATKDKS